MECHCVLKDYVELRYSLYCYSAYTLNSKLSFMVLDIDYWLL